MRHLKCSLYALIALSAICLLLKLDHRIGVPLDNVLADAMDSQSIAPESVSAMDATEQMAGLVFYNDGKEKATFSVYVNRPGMSFGYFFRGGGSWGSVDTGVGDFYIEGYDHHALLSANHVHISKIAVGERTMAIDPNAPFALVLSVDEGEAILYDMAGNVITPQRAKM